MRFPLLPKRLRRFLKAFCATCLLLFCGVFIYSCSAERHLAKEIAAADRDPVTGIIRGTEAVTLQPQTADTRTSGTAVLMIHGFLSARTDFADMGDRLARDGFTVRMIRLPGHGTTAREFGALPDGALFAAVRREYADLRAHYARVDVVGFSMGGSLATLLAASEPVDRLVLVAPYYGVTYKLYYLLPAEAWNTVIGWAIPYVAKPKNTSRINDHSQRDKYFQYQTVPTGGTRQLIALGREARKTEVLEKITCPVLILHSTGDDAASPRASRKAFERIGSTRKEIVWFEKSNHILFWDYENEEVKRRVEEFLLAP
jgi:carboxylesterase